MLRGERPAQRPLDALVAILTDPGGSVLQVGLDALVGVVPVDVAILTDPGGSVLRRRAQRPCLGPAGCDPHRPRRVGAARSIAGRFSRMLAMLRSSPTPEGRCCRSSARVPRPADQHGLRSSPTPEGRCCPTVKCQTSPPTNSCDPHRPRRVGAAHRHRHRAGPVPLVAILTDPGGSVLRRGPSRRPGRSARCDPHRPRRVGAA